MKQDLDVHSTERVDTSPAATAGPSSPITKLIKDGAVAVAYSPDYGAGWSSWADDKHREFLCMDESITRPLSEGNIDAAIKAAVARIPDLYTGGARSLTVTWLPRGTVFEIAEYDGSESVRVLSGGNDFMVAA